MSVSDSQLIGMEKRAALDLCKAEGVQARVSMEDGQPFMLTCDWVPTRCNLTIKNGKVISVGHG